MSEIPFVNLLGDSLERAAAADLAHGSRAARGRRWLRQRFGRGRLILVLAALALTGGALAATLQSPTPLATAQVSCSEGPSDQSPGPEGLPLGGQSPVAACLQEYRREHAVSMLRPTVRFVACRQTIWLVHVMVADGRPSQCRRLGLRPLPAGYSQATARVAVLERSLARLQHGRDCILPAALLHEIRALLIRQGFTGWRPEVGPSIPFASTGPCAQFPGTDRQPSDPYLALDPKHRVVMIGLGPPLSIERLRDAALPGLIRQSGARCLSSSDAKALARAALTRRGWIARFALTRELLGQQFDPPRQQRYDRNCTVAVEALASTATHTWNVWLNQRSAPALPPGQALPAQTAYGN